MTDDAVPGRRRTDVETGHNETLKILAVDDDAAYLRRLRLVLTRSGFEVATAHDGASALDQLRSDCAIGIMLVDLAMPGIDGIETVRRARIECAFPGLYAILLTASDGTDVKLRALDSGLDDFLTKTSSDHEILAKLRSAARRLEMERRLHLENAELQTLALTDELTGIANRRALFREAEAVLSAGRTLSVVLFDLDRFKHINDTWGHIAGDRILADVAATFKAHTRYGDIIGRYGGDEFVLLLPDTNPDEAAVIARRLCEKTSALVWPAGDAVITIALTSGLATSRRPDRASLHDLLIACDRQLYARKEEGRGMVAEA